MVLSVGGGRGPACAVSDPPVAELSTATPSPAARYRLCAQLEAAEPALRPHTHQVRHPRHHGVWLLTANICPRTHPRDDTARGQGRQILTYNVDRGGAERYENNV